MANKPFKIKNGLDAKRLLNTSSAVSSTDIDLSSGSHFTKTLTGDTTFTFSNPSSSGVASSFLFEVTGGQEGTPDYFDMSNVSINQFKSTAVTGWDFYLKPDNTRLYLTDRINSQVEEWHFGTAGDVSTLTLDFTDYVGNEETTPTGLYFKPDGTEMYLIGESSADDILRQYSLSTAWDISTASYTRGRTVSSITPNMYNPHGLFFKPDGTSVFICSDSTDAVHEYSMATAWNIGSSFAFVRSFSTLTQGGSVNSVDFKSDGTKMYTIDSSADSVFEYSLSTAWDISTASLSTTIDVSAQTAAPFALRLNSNGSKMYISGSGNVYEYDIGKPPDAAITWPTSVKWHNGVKPSDIPSGKKDLYVFMTPDGGTNYYAKQVGDSV